MKTETFYLCLLGSVWSAPADTQCGATLKNCALESALGKRREELGKWLKSGRVKFPDQLSVRQKIGWVTWSETLLLPADSPKMVTLPASPPNWPMFSLTQ